jgi:hypothetical protein
MSTTLNDLVADIRKREKRHEEIPAWMYAQVLALENQQRSELSRREDRGTEQATVEDRDAAALAETARNLFRKLGITDPLNDPTTDSFLTNPKDYKAAQSSGEPLSLTAPAYANSITAPLRGPRGANLSTPYHGNYAQLDTGVNDGTTAYDRVAFAHALDGACVGTVGYCLGAVQNAFDHMGYRFEGNQTLRDIMPKHGGHTWAADLSKVLLSHGFKELAHGIGRLPDSVKPLLKVGTIIAFDGTPEHPFGHTAAVAGFRNGQPVFKCDFECADWHTAGLGSPETRGTWHLIDPPDSAQVAANAAPKAGATTGNQRADIAHPTVFAHNAKLQPQAGPLV